VDRDLDEFAVLEDVSVAQDVVVVAIAEVVYPAGDLGAGRGRDGKETRRIAACINPPTRAILGFCALVFPAEGIPARPPRVT